MNKKGQTVIFVFSLLVLLLLVVLTSSYLFYVSAKSNVIDGDNRLELLSSAARFRGEFVEFVTLNNSYIDYVDSYGCEGCKFSLKDGNLYARRSLEDSSVEVVLSNFGFLSCSEYSFSVEVPHRFFYNGSCVVMIS